MIYYFNTPQFRRCMCMLIPQFKLLHQAFGVRLRSHSGVVGHIASTRVIGPVELELHWLTLALLGYLDLWDLRSKLAIACKQPCNQRVVAIRLEGFSIPSYLSVKT
ncbi:hypothetical protein KQX54_008654 [Cotesia glomerata]|uniref:Uncharacterized protein n=1 Tax=Cotesia glomerata TaxID=32391 RepID=A0AAV7IQ21_COTGL|nr:hypothetical protein KQX54_008654 [Cotesia glomerata]